MRITLKKIVASVILVILVISTFAALSTPHVKAQTTEAVITSYSWYTAPSNTVLATYAGDLVAVGEVENSGTTTLGMIYISGEALNSSGAILCPSEVPVLALPLLPGEKAPFYMDFNPAESIYPEDMSESWIANVTNVTLRVTVADATNQTQYTGLTTTNLNGFDNSGVYTVTGDVENTGSQTPQNVWVATTFYNSAGKVIGLNYTAYLTPPPSPGNSVPFVATPTDNSATLSNEVKSYSVPSPISTSIKFQCYATANLNLIYTAAHFSVFLNAAKTNPGSNELAGHIWHNSRSSDSCGCPRRFNSI